MKPVVIAKEREWSIAIKLGATAKQVSDVKVILSQVEKQWKKIYPDEGFNYSFLNEAITRLYDQETKTAWLMNVAMGITIFISCMGLFGLGMFASQRRTKEIGIRKVLGASVTEIVAMLSKDFVSWWVFVLAGATAVLIALLTVSFQAVRAAFANPVKSLRTE